MILQHSEKNNSAKLRYHSHGCGESQDDCVLRYAVAAVPLPPNQQIVKNPRGCTFARPLPTVTERPEGPQLQSVPKYSTNNKKSFPQKNLQILSTLLNNNEILTPPHAVKISIGPATIATRRSIRAALVRTLQLPSSPTENSK